MRPRTGVTSSGGARLAPRAPQGPRRGKTSRSIDAAPGRSSRSSFAILSGAESGPQPLVTDTRTPLSTKTGRGEAWPRPGREASLRCEGERPAPPAPAGLPKRFTSMHHENEIVLRPCAVNDPATLVQQPWGNPPVHRYLGLSNPRATCLGARHEKQRGKVAGESRRRGHVARRAKAAASQPIPSSPRGNGRSRAVEKETPSRRPGHPCT